MRSPQDPGKRRRRRTDVSPITGKVMLRPAVELPPRSSNESIARIDERLAAIFAALPIEPSGDEE